MSDQEKLRNLVLAPYILKATALIGHKRDVGGNQFRHAFLTLGILLDYKMFDNYVLLKASLIHDLIEDVPGTNIDELRSIDYQANEVVDLVLEVTRPKGMDKITYLKGILENGSYNAKILKVADRISNITDLHVGIYTLEKVISYLNQTEKYVLPIAKSVNEDMYKELSDLIINRKNRL
jgi:GTP pyrophosphokinase